MSPPGNDEDDCRKRIALALLEHGIALAGHILDDLVSAARGDVAVELAWCDAPAASIDHLRPIAEKIAADEAVEANAREWLRRQGVEDQLTAEQFKHRAFVCLIQQGAVLVHFDPRHEDADVPEQYEDQATLVLRLGWDLQPPVSMSWDDDGITASLVFSGVPYLCLVPWEAVYLLVIEGTSHGVLWSDDVPADARHENEPPAPAPKPGGHLRLVP